MSQVGWCGHGWVMIFNGDDAMYTILYWSGMQLGQSVRQLVSQSVSQLVSQLVS
jgi:hypothetical protein